jgi:predicted metal-binding membrane protein
VAKLPPETVPRFVASAIFLASAAITLYFVRSMSGAMLMPGGWTMSMMWMTMPGWTIWSTAAMFLLMWQAMMIAMMLPSSWPMIELYRRVARSAGETHAGLATVLVGAGYFAAWLALGAVAFIIGFTWSTETMRSAALSRSAPLLSGGLLMVAGAFQFTPWKDACLKHCRSPLLMLGESWKRGLRAALRIGWRHGLYCVGCCWALMLIQMVLGVMNLSAMILVAAVIGFEKLWKQGPLLAKFAGATAILFGVSILLRSLNG